MRAVRRLSVVLAVAAAVVWQPGAASAASIVGGGLWCSGNAVSFSGPIVHTTQNVVGSNAHLAFYPRLLRHDGRQWVVHNGGPWFFDEPLFGGGFGMGGTGAMAGPEWSTAPGYQGSSTFSFSVPAGHWWAVEQWVYDRGVWLLVIAGSGGPQVCRS